MVDEEKLFVNQFEENQMVIAQHSGHGLTSVNIILNKISRVMLILKCT